MSVSNSIKNIGLFYCLLYVSYLRNHRPNMFASIRNKLKWNIIKCNEENKNQTSFLFIAFIGILEKVLLWKNLWFSIMFILLLNALFLICVNQEINLLEFIFKIFIVLLIIDAFETWLKFKHRTVFLKKIANYDITKFKSATMQLSNWLNRIWLDYMYLRDRNHTKAFLMLQIIFGVTFFISKHISGYTLIYILAMILSISYKITPPIIRILRKAQLNAESDLELEGLIPEESEANMDLLSIDHEQNRIIDEKQNLDYWKPEDLPIEEVSDSSENSSSLATNLSMEKMEKFGNAIETSDSSEDEYMPRVINQPKEQFRSTVNELPVNTWTNAALNVIQNLGGAVTSMIYTQEDNKRERFSSVESSDGFEIVDKNDVM